MEKIPMVTPRSDRMVRRRFDRSAFQAKDKLSRTNFRASMKSNGNFS